MVTGSAAEAAGLAVGDRLVSCNGQAVTSWDALIIDGGKGIMTVQRGQAELELPYRTGEDGKLGITKGTRVDVTGIKAIADALCVSASLTSVR